MNRRGLKPRKMRHRIKVEDSNEQSNEVEEATDDEFGDSSLLSGDEAGNFEEDE